MKAKEPDLGQDGKSAVIKLVMHLLYVRPPRARFNAPFATSLLSLGSPATRQLGCDFLRLWCFSD